MKTIFLVRHGQKVSESGNPGLTAKGQSQAIAAGAYLSQFPVTEIIASPFLRTHQTAAGIAQSVLAPLLHDDRLIERMNWDDQTISYQEFCTEWFKATHNRGYVPMWGDSSLATGDRIAEVIADLKDDATTVLVSHGGAIADFLRNEFGDDSVAEILQDFPPFGTDYDYQNCAITQLTYDEDTQEYALVLFHHQIDTLA